MIKKILLMLTLAVSAGFASTTVSAQQYYVVIGVFAKEDNAIKFTGYARSKFLNAEYLINRQRSRYYVFTMRTSVMERAQAHNRMLRSETEFADAWIYEGLLGDDQPPTQEEQPFVDEPNLDTLVIANTIDIMDLPEQPEPDPQGMDSLSTDSVTTTAAPQPVVLPKAKGKYFKFKIEDTEGNTMPGEVHYVDLDRGRDIGTFKANDYVDLLSPGRDRPLTIVCGIFGYQEVIKFIDYNNPGTTEGAYQDEHGAWVIPYKLERLQKLDVSVMYKVSFFRDAVVMTRESKPEMDQLVSMMKLNPEYKIKVHAHCNGNNDRRIIALGTPKNYFDIKGSNEIPGSAKQLTSMRAEAIVSYLSENGINADRIKTYSWGGTNMLVGETSSSARLNDRIEIEILND